MSCYSYTEDDMSLNEYAIAMAVAKRARQITTDKLIRGMTLDNNSVQVASEEFNNNKFHIISE